MTKISTLLLILAYTYSIAQAPAIQWQKTLGGLNYDGAQGIRTTSDGGYILAGWSSSTDGDVTGNHGNGDFWVVKLYANGDVQWQKSLGGTSYDEAYAIQTTTDGGYIVGGYSQSTNGDVTENNGFVDYWVVKLDATGTIQWQKSIGGFNLDRLTSLQTTSDGGYILAGYSQSNTGDVTGNHGGFDFWIVKLDATGTIQWQKSFGGSGDDYANCIKATLDGGYIVSGQTSSTDGDVMAGYGNYDYWIVKINATGTLQWQKTLGGSNSDIAYDIQTTLDGGYIVAGSSSSIDGDVTGNHGISDYWVVKLDAGGSIVWQKTFGGSGDDGAYLVKTTSDGGYIVLGYGASIDGDVTGNHGAGDYWVFKINANGVLQWQQSYGGASDDYVRSIENTSDGGYILAGNTLSNDGDVSGNHGGKDCWVVKLEADGLATSYFDKQTIIVYPNPATDILQINTPNNTIISKVKVFDVSGKVILEQNQNSSALNIQDIAKGTYTIDAESDEHHYYSKFIKQ